MNKLKIHEIVYSICCLLTVCVICGSILYGCSRASDQYYEFASTCVKNGGSWIPTGEYKGNCTYGRSINERSP